MGADVVVRIVLVSVGMIEIALACAWRVGYRRRRLDELTQALHAPEPELRARAAEALVRLGLDRAASPLLAHVREEADAHVRAAAALAVARRQWEPAAVAGVAELREWASAELDAQGIPVQGFGPALTRLADMGGPRRPDDGPRPAPVVEDAPEPVKKAPVKKAAAKKPATKPAAKKPAAKTTKKVAKKPAVKKAPVKKPAKKTTKLAANPKVREADETAAAVHDAVTTSADRAHTPIEPAERVSP